MYKKQVILLLICSFVVLLDGCSVKRAISESKAIAELPDDVIIKEILRNNLTDYGFFITKALVNYSDPLNEFNFYLSVKHDEKGRYLASLRTLLGIEVYRLFIDRDTILINDRFNKDILAGNEDYLVRNFGFGYKCLLYVFGDFNFSDKIVSDSTGCVYGLKSFTEYQDGRRIILNVGCDERKVKNIQIDNYKKAVSVDMSFDNFMEEQLIRYPGEILIRIEEKGIELAMKIESIELQWSGEMEFIPGNNYETIILK